MREAFIRVVNCQDCPHGKAERAYTADSFEHEFDWFCDHPAGLRRRIAGHVEGWTKVRPCTQVPEWCPLLRVDLLIPVRVIFLEPGHYNRAEKKAEVDMKLRRPSKPDQINLTADEKHEAIKLSGLDYYKAQGYYLLVELR